MKALRIKADVPVILTDLPPELSVLVETGGIFEVRATVSGKTRLAVKMTGRDASCRISLAYRAAGAAREELTVYVEHMADGTSSTVMVKGSSDDAARVDFKGMVRIGEGLHKVAGRMVHKGLLLGPEARIAARPELTVLSEDVKCSHGSAIGSVDPKAVFYLRSRCLTERQAKRLFADAFVAEVLGDGA